MCLKQVLIRFQTNEESRCAEPVGPTARRLHPTPGLRHSVATDAGPPPRVYATSGYTRQGRPILMWRQSPNRVHCRSMCDYTPCKLQHVRAKHPSHKEAFTLRAMQCWISDLDRALILKRYSDIPVFTDGAMQITACAREALKSKGSIPIVRNAALDV